MPRIVEMAGLVAYEADDGSRFLEVEFAVRSASRGVDDFTVKVDVPNRDDANAAIDEASAILHRFSLELAEALQPST